MHGELTGVELTGVELTWVGLTGVVFPGVELTGVELAEAELIVAGSTGDFAGTESVEGVLSSEGLSVAVESPHSLEAISAWPVARAAGLREVPS